MYFSNYVFCLLFRSDAWRLKSARYLVQSPSIDENGKVVPFPKVDSKERKYDGGKHASDRTLQIWAAVAFFGLLMPFVNAWIAFSRVHLTFLERALSASVFVALMTVVSSATDGNCSRRKVLFWFTMWTISAQILLWLRGGLPLWSMIFLPLCNIFSAIILLR